MSTLKKIALCVVTLLSFLFACTAVACMQIKHQSAHDNTKQPHADPPLATKATLIAEAHINIPEFPRVFQGIAYSDTGKQLMVWDQTGNISIYDIIDEKLTLNKEESYTVDKNIFRQPGGISFKESEKKCVWFPALSFYNALIRTTYNPPSTFTQLRQFLNQCRHINPHASAIVKKYCKELEHNDFSGVDALAYDKQQQLTPVISGYNEPQHHNIPDIGVDSKLLGESLDMKTLAYFYEPLAGHSAEPWQKIIFYRHLKPWREYILSDLSDNDDKYQIAPCSLSPQGNLACIVLYKFPSYGRHIGSFDWLKSIFQSHRKDIVIIILDTNDNTILLKEEISGFVGVEEQLIWRAAFCEEKKEFVLLNASTGTIKRYRY